MHRRGPPPNGKYAPGCGSGPPSQRSGQKRQSVFEQLRASVHHPLAHDHGAAIGDDQVAEIDLADGNPSQRPHRRIQPQRLAEHCPRARVLGSTIDLFRMFEAQATREREHRCMPRWSRS
jgi:hypothetical protein